MKFLLICFLFISCWSIGQRNVKKIRIDAALNEISGLEQYNDSILVAINDSGNENALYFVNFEGKILKKTIIANAKNNDWEDLTVDDDRNLYIGDFGNNLSARKDLAVLKVNLDSAYLKDSIYVDFIIFSFSEQTTFPPTKGEQIFDCESLAFRDGDLVLLTKNTDKKAVVSYIYSLPTEPGNYQISKRAELYSRAKLKDMFTSIDIYQGETYYLTYKELSWNKNRMKFARLTQKEALVVLSDGRILIASEGNPLLGGPFFHFITLRGSLINESW